MSEHKKSVDTETQTDEAQKLPIVQPLWKGWHRPNMPSEALDLGAKYAAMEGLWCSGQLFELREHAEREMLGESRHYRGHPDFVSNPDAPKPKPKTPGGKVVARKKDPLCYCERCIADRARQEELEHNGLTCGDVKACSVGILIMASLDGPAVNAYFYSSRLDALLKSLGVKRSRYTDNGIVENILIEDPVGGPACLFLHAGMVRLARERLLEQQAKLDAAGIPPFDGDDEDAPDRTIPADPKDMIEGYIRMYNGIGPRGGKAKESKAAQAKRIRGALENHKQSIIGWNDGDDDLDGVVNMPLLTGEQKHEAIVKGFLYGVEYAREYESQLGFGGNPEPVAA